ALWLRCQNPQIQPVLAEPGALPEHKIAAPTAQVIYQQLLSSTDNTGFCHLYGLRPPYPKGERFNSLWSKFCVKTPCQTAANHVY
ncbi:MAG: hypothetical protein LBS10_10190, partial [Gracilibacteraceae bacterium]|nr:hypothetical protein [Gracilibacteraceae bacterium]